MGQLPYIDVHVVDIGASRANAWMALEHYVAGLLRGGERSHLTRLLATEPRAGFSIEERRPGERIALAGRHRFARYELVFGLTSTGAGTTRLSAHTYAAFPGARGRAYRAAVIDTRAHVVVTRQVLRRIAGAAIRPGIGAGRQYAARSLVSRDGPITTRPRRSTHADG